MPWCIPREYAEEVWFLILLAAILIFLWYMNRRSKSKGQKKGEDDDKEKIGVWRDKIKDARLMIAEDDCPKNIAYREEQNLKAVATPDGHEEALKKNVVLDESYREARRTSASIYEIRDALDRGKVTYEELGISEDSFEEIKKWFEKNYPKGKG